MRGKFLFGAASAALLAACFSGSASAQTGDPSGDASTTSRLGIGESANGEFNPAGDSDWYRLTVRAGMSYQINLDGVGVGETPAIDPVVIVHSSTGDEIASNDDSAESLNSELRYRPTEAGDVFVEARPYSEEATGPYTLRVVESEVPPDDVGNDAASAARFTPGQTASGAIGEEGDEDYYRLSARSGQIYRLSLNSAGGDGGLTDPLLSVVDADGNELASNDDSNESLNSYLEFVPQSSGDVFIVATGFGAAAGAYTLSGEAARLPPDDAGNNDETRARINIGQSREGAFQYPSDQDWYRIRLAAGESYRFTLTGAEGSEIDPVLSLYDNEGEQIGGDDDGGDGFNSYLEFTAPSDGDYYLGASAFSQEATGGYTLAALAGDIPPDASTDASLSADGDYRDGVLSPAGDKDWYRIDLTEGQSLRIAVTSAEGAPNALADPYITIYGADGAQLAQDDDGGDGLNSWLEFTAPSAGAYFLEVRGFVEEAGEGAYSIAITPGEISADANSPEPLVANGEGRASTINAPDDADWFAIDMVEGRPYRFNLTSEDFDPTLTLLDMEGNIVASDDDGGTGANAYLTFVSPTGGTYYASVASYNSSSQGSYYLNAVDTDVPGNVGTDETLAPEGDDRGSAIEFTGDIDTFSTTLEANTTYTIEVVGEGDTPLADPFLTVLSAAGETVTTDDDSGDGLDARLRFKPETTDMYYLQASGLGGSLGHYRISIAPQQ